MTGNGTGAANASTFTRMHINCSTSGGSPITGVIGVNLAYGDGNTFVGGDIESCDTMLSLGAGASNNTFSGVRNEQCNTQVSAASGSQYNLWLTGGTMATGKLTDSGTHNTFWDAFHRQFNNLNGDLWRSQSDATITNHVYTGIGLGNVRGRQEEWQTDVPGSPGNYQNAWLWGPGDGTAGQQTWILEDILNGINRLSIGQQTTAGGNNQTAINGAGTGAVLLNASNGAGTGGVIIGSGGATSTQVAAFDSSGNESLDGAVQWFNGTTLTYEWECASLTSCTLQNANATTPGRVFKSNVNGQTDLDSEGSTDVTINNTSTGGTGGFSVYAGGPTYYNTNVFAIQPNGSGGAFYKFPSAKSITGYGCAHFDNSGYLTNTGTDCGTGSGSGSVTSVALSLPAQFSVSGSPITSSGTFTVSWASQAGHSFFAGLDGSGSGTPAFRTIAADDVPTLNQSTSGNAATATASDHSPTQCSSGLYSQGDTTGWAANCATVQYSQLGGSVPTWNQSTTGNAATATNTTGNAATATALAATPGQCSSGNYATGIAAAGTANCGAVQYSPAWRHGHDVEPKHDRHSSRDHTGRVHPHRQQRRSKLRLHQLRQQHRHVRLCRTERHRQQPHNCIPGHRLRQHHRHRLSRVERMVRQLRGHVHRRRGGRIQPNYRLSLRSHLHQHSRDREHSHRHGHDDRHHRNGQLQSHPKQRSRLRDGLPACRHRPSHHLRRHILNQRPCHCHGRIHPSRLHHVHAHLHLRELLTHALFAQRRTPTEKEQDGIRARPRA